MEKRKANVMFNKNGKGFTTTRITLPVPWIKDMGLNETNKEVIIEYEDEKITIKKERV
jgi:bifunctional DNA-binding transcriptional regulator/antitoxin component of YhaV-PrlF toxin-antitoxin module